MEANYLKQFRQKIRTVWYNETTAPVRGYGVCYDPNHIGEAVTAVDKTRGKVVQNPDATNNKHFAGIISGRGEPYVAEAAGQFVDIIESGACFVHMGNASCTIEDILTCDCGDEAGQFLQKGYVGRGSVTLLQTLTAEGLCPAMLHDGNQSGLCYTFTPAVGGGAEVMIPTGIVYCKAAALTSNVTFTLADGLQDGEMWSLNVIGDMGDAADVIITVTSGIKALDDATAVATVTSDDIGDICEFMWLGDVWSLLHNIGGALA